MLNLNAKILLQDLPQVFSTLLAILVAKGVGRIKLVIIPLDIDQGIPHKADHLDFFIGIIDIDHHDGVGPNRILTIFWTGICS